MGNLTADRSFSEIGIMDRLPRTRGVQSTHEKIKVTRKKRTGNFIFLFIVQAYWRDYNIIEQSRFFGFRYLINPDRDIGQRRN
jgi:hypothetical protein